MPEEIEVSSVLRGSLGLLGVRATGERITRSIGAAEDRGAEESRGAAVDTGRASRRALADMGGEDVLAGLWRVTRRGTRAAAGSRAPARQQGAELVRLPGRTLPPLAALFRLEVDARGARQDEDESTACPDGEGSSSAEDDSIGA